MYHVVLNPYLRALICFECGHLSLVVTENLVNPAHSRDENQSNLACRNSEALVSILCLQTTSNSFLSPGFSTAFHSDNSTIEALREQHHISVGESSGKRSRISSCVNKRNRMLPVGHKHRRTRGTQECNEYKNHCCDMPGNNLGKPLFSWGIPDADITHLLVVACLFSVLQFVHC
jgi:hypothetical protein